MKWHERADLIPQKTYTANVNIQSPKCWAVHPGRLIVYVNIIKTTGGSVVVKVLEVTPDGSTVAVLTSKSLSSVGVTRLEIGPGVTESSDVSAWQALAPHYLIEADVTAGTNITFRIHATEIAA